MDSTSWHTPRTLKKIRIESRRFLGGLKRKASTFAAFAVYLFFSLPSIRIVTEEVWQYVVLFQLTREKDDGKYEIMMAVTMTQQEGPTA